MIDDGMLQPVRKGLYAVSPEISGVPISLPLVTNRLYGLSYVPMDYAFSHYGIIPERVIEVTSMTTKRGKVYDLPVGRFSYTHSQPQLYSIGIDRIENPEQSGFFRRHPLLSICEKQFFIA
jgi:hypothetical protein